LHPVVYHVFMFEVCPEGYYGDHCMMPCECPNENFLCHAKDGCVCRQGFTGMVLIIVREVRYEIPVHLFC
jgi:hypothetical protein